MTQAEALQALEALAKDKKVSKKNFAYKTALEAVNNPNVFVKCGANVGSGNYASSKSWLNVTCLLLSNAGIPYEAINDAPRNGKAGDKVRVIHLHTI